MNKPADSHDKIKELESLLFQAQQELVHERSARESAEQELLKTLALQQDKTELEQRVAERSEQLEQAAQQLAQANQMLRAVLATQPAGVWISDSQGRLIQKNEMADQLWGGNAPLSNNIAGYEEYQGFWPETGKRVKANEWTLARALTTDQAIVGDIVDILRFDGKRATILSSAAPIHDQNGHLIGGVVVSQDITQQRELERQSLSAAAEAEQRASELDAIFTSMTDAVLVYDHQGILLRANPAAIENLGFNPAEASRQEIAERMAVRDLDGTPIPFDKLPVSRALKGEIVKEERLQMAVQNGSNIHIRAAASPLYKEGKLIGAVVVWNDVSERERLLHENQLSKSLLEAIINIDPGGISIVTGDDMRFQMVNPAYRAITPHPEFDPINRPYTDVWPASEGFDSYRLLQHVLQTGEEIHLNHYERKFPDGVTHYYSYHLLRLDWDEQPAVLSVLWETTQLEEIQRKLRRTATELERSNQELESFAYIASHDLQEPLRKIQAFSERLESKASPRLTKEEHDYLDRMQSASSRMSRMINDLLTYSRVTTKAQPRRSVDLNQVAAEVISDLELRIEQTQALVVVDPLPVIEADPLQMRQLLQNLIGNALKFQKPGVPPNVHIYSKTDPVQPPSSGSSSRDISIYVEDNGIGFDEKYMDRLFQPFQRLHRRDEYEGNGIGLAICRKIVDRYGGRITAHSTPSEGSIFIVTLPET